MNEGSLRPQADILPVRRVVTGHDDQGRSSIILDEASPHVTPFMGIPGFAVIDLWRNTATPAEIAVASDPCSPPLEIAPPAGGAVFRTTQFPPERTWRPDGGAAAEGNPHPHMHATRTLDYAIVLSGEIWLVTDNAETRLRAGDVVVQQGTRHAWANRSDASCVVAFVMIDARPHRS
jgi:mannose-6-phosphate isomerase-like protein (cupin superfamily)